MYIKWMFFSSVALSPIAAVAAEPVELLPDHIVRRIAEDEFETATQNLVKSGAIQRGILSGAKRWPISGSVKVCYFGGSVSLRKKISQIAAEWNSVGSNVSLDFGNTNNPRLCSNEISHIRVGFSQKGYWSLVGQDSIVYAGQAEQSLNLALFDVSPPNDPEFKRVVLHEFGHALGLQHEHQHPTDSCESEFNWPVVYSYLRSSPNFWSQETIDFNMRSRPYHDGDIATSFNPKSIMLYSFPSAFYHQGNKSKCFSSGNFDLSQGDKDIIKTAYGLSDPFNQSSSLAALEKAAQGLNLSERSTVLQRTTLLATDNTTKSALIAKTETISRTPDFGAALRDMKNSTIMFQAYQPTPPDIKSDTPS